MFEGNEQNQLDLRLYRIWLKAFRAVYANIVTDMESYDLREHHFMILELLYSKGPHPIQKISDILAIPSGSITYVVDKLEKDGWVERQPSPTDRRGSIVILTEKGKAQFNEIFPMHVETITQNLSFISNEDKAQLIDALKKIGIGAEQLKIQK